jgi:PRC-barrel domain
LRRRSTLQKLDEGIRSMTEQVPCKVVVRSIATTWSTTMAVSPTTSLDTRETVSLIGSDKVEGTPVYRSNGEKVGRIERIMVDKIGGKVAYAVMSFGGFMGIGEDYYPLPWSVLTYNPQLDGYEVNITEQQLNGAPRYGRHESWDWSDRSRGQRVDDYYGVRPAWR